MIASADSVEGRSESVESSGKHRDLAELLTLEREPDGSFGSRHIQVNSNGVIFGGQLIAQSLYAAAASLEKPLPAHHLQLTFLRPGLRNRPLRFEVRSLLTGRRFTVQQVSITQGERLVAMATASFHSGEPGPHAESAMLMGVPSPEGLVPLAETARRFAGRIGHAAQRRAERIGGIDFRPLDAEHLLLLRDSKAMLRYWVRVDHALPEDPLLHQAALGFVSDYWLPLTGLFPHVDSKFDHGLHIASLNHSIWFHRPMKADEWLFVDGHSPWSGHSRGLTIGRVYDRQGRLAASVAQESLYRGWVEMGEGLTVPGFSS